MSCNDENSSKWTCKRCTFENYPKTKKCIMCLAPNTVTTSYINESNFTNEDCETKMNSLIPDDLSSDQSLNDLDKKWNCQSCTFLNYQKSVKCAMCLTPRQTSLSLSSSNSIVSSTILTKNQEKSLLNLIPVSINKSSSTVISTKNEINKLDNQEDLIKINNLNVKNTLNDLKEPELTLKSNLSNKVIKPSTSDTDNKQQTIILGTNCNLENLTNPPSPNNPSNSLSNSLNSSSYSLNNDNNDNKLINSLQTSLNKWSCSSCTYFNWPKSIKCVICFTVKPSSINAINSSNSSLNINSGEIQAEGAIQTICSGGKTIDDSIRNTPSPINCTAVSQRNRLNTNVNNVNSTILNYNQLNRRKTREFVDWIWLEACSGLLNGDPDPVLVYLNNGGDLARQLSLIECNFLNKHTLVGYTLVHLGRSEILEILLENRSPNRAKRVPCSVGNYAAEVRKLIVNSLKQRKGDFPCYFLNDFGTTFALPQDILELSPAVQECLFEDLLDKEVQNELEESSIINWSLELNVTLGSRLYALWNRSRGDCLLDSVLQATYGVFDKDNRLRKALAESLMDAGHILFNRFKEAEILKVSHQLPYTLDQMQWEEDWAVILSIASQPGSALEQFHIFVLSHILRRPIIVYGIKFTTNYRGEKLALAGFQGVYLPLHYDPKFCNKSPIALTYTKGHFTALVPMEPTNYNGKNFCKKYMEPIQNCVMMKCNYDENGHVNNCSNCIVVSGTDNMVKNNFDNDCCYLPLVTFERELLPLQFLVKNELGRQEEIMRQYLDCCVTKEGILVCSQKLTKKPSVVQLMINDWMDFYRNFGIPVVNNKCEQSNSKGTNNTTNYISADEDSD